MSNIETAFFKNCPNCNKIIYFKNISVLKKALKNNSSCKECSSKNIRKYKQETDFFRNCPRCNKIIYHSNLKQLNKAKKSNTTCKNCSRIKGTKLEKLTRNCPQCKKDIVYKGTNSKNKADKDNTICKNCVISNLKLKHTRYCPTCNEPIYYKHKSTFLKACERNSQCDNCKQKLYLKRICPTCNYIIEYKTKNSWLLALRKKATHCIKCRNINRVYSEETIKKMSLSLGGNGTPIKYRNFNCTRDQLNEWAIQIKYKDNWKCRICNSKEELHAHHILPKSQYPELILDLNNGITLCAICHKLEHEKIRNNIKECKNEIK